MESASDGSKELNTGAIESIYLAKNIEASIHVPQRVVHGFGGKGILGTFL